MKFSTKWLHEWVNPDSNIDQLVEKLTMAGLEVESVTQIGAGLEGVLVGKVLAVTPHPDADRLRVCQVTVAEDVEPLSIICGAPNVRAGLKVAVAMIGAVLPGDVKIRQAKIRGISSSGMLCSAKELGLGEGQEGILELALDAPLGISISEYLSLPDHILDLSLTPNRGDCLSVAGVAREVAAICESEFHPLQPQTIPPVIDTVFPVSVNDGAACPRYTSRVIKGINPHAQTPLWLQARLERSGLRSIHPIVDITNYVMLELGQPLHAFDLKHLAGHITVRQSNPGETVTLLDGQTLSLEKPALVIADNEKILALAGIMGGEQSAVTTETCDLFLESAHFTPDAICPTLRRLAVKSDSAHRYERGVDPELPLAALNRLTELVLQITGGQAGPIICVEDTTQLPKPVTVSLRHQRIERILGISLDVTTVTQILQRLKMTFKPTAEGWEVTVPSYRFDIRQEIDLIEELARLYGYNRIEPKALQAPLTMQPVSEQHLSQSRVRTFWADRGYSEAINYSFVDPELSKLLNPKHPALPLSNPISADMAVMRTSLWMGLIKTALFNLNRQQTRVRLFEIGACFLQSATEFTQQTRIAGISIGNKAQEQWGIKAAPVDFFDIKGDLEAYFDLTKNSEHYHFAPTQHPALHPGRSAELTYLGQPVGYVGALHPQLQQQLGFPSTVYLFELLLDAVAQAQLPMYITPSKYPSIRRDLAFIVDEQFSWRKIHDSIQACVGGMLKNIQLFDIYRGEGIAPGKKSIALGLTFQSASRTLIDEEVDTMVSQVIKTLNENYQAILRN
ncbi:MAG TPA: phenylalanine--tRNA ligase subunit beta [Gammaproteobacteria bacterium]|nr:phenylalanine--tRNA ligase subunit beta [Gammaproteobacteria bacterium]